MSDEELSLRHRRASEATAGTPSAAVRAAIQREAEVQAAARRTVPEAPAAANDSYWPMRAVAMLAVVAIAAGLWWQMRPQVATPIVQVAQVAQTVQATAEMESRQRQEALPSPPPPARSEASVAAQRSMRKSAGNIERATVAPAAVAAGAAPSAAGAAIADAAPNPLAAEIARRLPDAWNSTTPVDRLWVRVDAEGTVIDAGQKANEPSAGLRVASESVVLRNAHGVLLRVSIKREPSRP